MTSDADDVISAAFQGMIPYDTQEIMKDYVLTGRPPSGFFQALFSNNLMESMGHADERNRRALFSICCFIRNKCPSECHGSPAIVRAWVETGGMSKQSGTWDFDKGRYIPQESA